MQDLLPCRPKFVNELVIRTKSGGQKSQTTMLQASISTTNAVPTVLYSFTPNKSTSVRVYATVEGIKSDETDDYGVDVAASYRVSALGVVTARLASTPALEQPAAALLTTPYWETDGTIVRLMVTGAGGAVWRWGGSVSISERSVAA